nr:acyltransferase domain-containing protein [Tahibacter caeni]
MFSGQGSQHFQMARALFDHDAGFRAEMRRLDARLVELAGVSAIAALYDDANDRSVAFDALELTHPAIFMVECALARTLMDAGVRPDLCLGTSLGSFAAAVIAGCLDVEQALAAVVQQAAALEACGEAGAMIAVLDELAVFERQRLHDVAELAAVNFPNHFVVSAPLAAAAGVEARLKAARIAFQRLPVGYAFHSRWIDAAQAPFAAFLPSLRTRAGDLPLVCCDRVAVLDALPPDFLWQVVRRPIRFAASVDLLERQSAPHYVDLGPSGTLATFLRHQLPAARRPAVRSVLSPFGDDRARLAALLAEWPRRRQA